MDNYQVYILESQSSGRFYIGQTSDLEDRLRRHQSGYVRSTKGRGPWKLYWTYKVDSRSAAIVLERKLKNLKSRSRLLAYLKNLEDG